METGNGLQNLMFIIHIEVASYGGLVLRPSQISVYVEKLREKEDLNSGFMGKKLLFN